MTLAAQLEARLRPALAHFGFADARVQPATDARFGDYQTNAAMILAKQQRANPRQLAAQIIERLDVADLCAPPEIAGAGFINFRLLPSALESQLPTLAADPRLGVPAPEQPQTIIIDFSSPNVAKPMHIGHIRSTILGDALARIAAFLGHRVVRDNHIGDWGTQFGMLLHAWKTERDPAALATDPLGEMERLYKTIQANIKRETLTEVKSRFPAEFAQLAAANLDDDEIVEKILAVTVITFELSATASASRKELVKLQDGDEENLGIWREMQRLSQAQFDAIYARLGITFDITLGESFYNPWLKDTAQQLRTAGIARESEGALCVFSDATLPEKDDPFLISRDGQWVPLPALVQKADGAANYTTTDLATLDYRQRTYAPHAILYVTDGRQQHHFRQLFAIFRRWQPAAAARLEHIWFGTILGPDGRPFKTRSGETIRLADLLDEAEERAFAIVTEKNPALPEAERREIARVIGLGAVKYADLLPNRQSDYTFSWDKMLALTGNTAPYLQNAFVRIRGIFRKAEGEVPNAGEMRNAEGGVRNEEPAPVMRFPIPHSPFRISHPAERALALKLFQFGEVLPQILDDHRPNLLCNYLYELASLFHSFFEACPVLKAEPDLRASRLTLCALTARTLKEGLALLGIGVPERM